MAGVYRAGAGCEALYTKFLETIDKDCLVLGCKGVSVLEDLPYYECASYTIPCLCLVWKHACIWEACIWDVVGWLGVPADAILHTFVLSPPVISAVRHQV